MRSQWRFAVNLHPCGPAEGLGGAAGRVSPASRKYRAMKTLFIAAGAPYPPRGGAPQRWWQNINVLAARGPVHVLSIGGGGPSNEQMPVATEWVHLDSSDYPAKRNLRSFLARIVAPRQYSVPDVLATAAINGRVRAMIERVQPDLIVLSHWKNDYPGALKGRHNVVLDMHNIESLVGNDVADIKPAPLRRFLLWRWRARERTLVRTASRTWVCSRSDAAELKRLGAQLPAPVIWPNAVDVTFYGAVREGTIALPVGLQRNGATIVFVGLYSYGPNRFAAMELTRDVVPYVFERMPNARFIFVGASPTQEMMEAAQKDPRIIVTGRVDDVRQYLAVSDVCIVPIRTGGGTRAKILECFAAKVPVVSTTKGAEGIDAVPGRDIYIAESAVSLADAAIELLSNRDAARRQADAAYELVCRSYSWDSLLERLDAALPTR